MQRESRRARWSGLVAAVLAAAAASAAPPREVLSTTDVSSVPGGWQLDGAWAFGKQLSMTLLPKQDAKLSRELTGDGHILARFSPGPVDAAGICFGCSFEFPAGRIALERRLADGQAYVFMAVRQGDKALGERRLAAPAGEIEIMLQRKAGVFSGWLAQPGQDFKQVGSLRWAEVGPAIRVGVSGRSTANAAASVALVVLEVVGAKPDVVTMSREKVLGGYDTGAGTEAPTPAQRATAPTTPPAQPAAAPEKLVRSADGRFTDHGDGTITDTGTGLMWTKKDSLTDTGKTFTWEEANAYAGKLNTGGHSDWRLPTIEEASSLFDRDKTNKDYEGGYLALDPIFAPGGPRYLYTSYTSTFIKRMCGIVAFHRWEIYRSASRNKREKFVGVRAVRKP